MIHCPSCAGPLRFEIESQSMVCDYCRNHFDPQKINDNPRNDAKTADTFDAFVYICPSCGAELVTTDKNDAIGFCPYCGGASMIFDKLRQEWRPESVIPFRVTKEQCKEAYVKEVKRHWFVSRKYRNPQLIESFRGIFMPYWDYQATVKGHYSIKADAPERSVGNNDYTTDHYTISGEMDATLTGFSHDASISFDDHLSEKLAPYDLSQAVPFNASYLCGFYAEAGDADARHYNQYAHETFEAYFEDTLGDTPALQNALSSKSLHVTSYDRIPYKVNISRRGLYPVWFMSYRRGDKITYATVNGQTGKVGADLPLSPLRVLIAILGTGAVLFGLMMLMMNMLPSIKATTMLGLSALISLTGVYLLQHSLLSIIENAVLNSDYQILQKHSKKNVGERFSVSDSPGVTFLITIVTAIAIIMYTSDGSYKHFWGDIGKYASLAGLVYLIVMHVKQARAFGQLKRMQFNGDSLLRNGIITASKRFLTVNRVGKILIYAFSALHLLLVAADPASKSMLYTLSIFATVELFVFALLHLRFQAAFAKRKPPQFNKKGALYDEK